MIRSMLYIMIFLSFTPVIFACKDNKPESFITPPTFLKACKTYGYNTVMVPPVFSALWLKTEAEMIRRQNNQNLGTQGMKRLLCGRPMLRTAGVGSFCFVASLMQEKLKAQFTG